MSILYSTAAFSNLSFRFYSKYLIAVLQGLSGILSGTLSYIDFIMKYSTTALLSPIYTYTDCILGGFG